MRERIAGKLNLQECYQKSVNRVQSRTNQLLNLATTLPKEIKINIAEIY